MRVSKKLDFSPPISFCGKRTNCGGVVNKNRISNHPNITSFEDSYGTEFFHDRFTANHAQVLHANHVNLTLILFLLCPGLAAAKHSMCTYRIIYRNFISIWYIFISDSGSCSTDKVPYFLHLSISPSVFPSLAKRLPRYTLTGYWLVMLFSLFQSFFKLYIYF